MQRIWERAGRGVRRWVGQQGWVGLGPNLGVAAQFTLALAGANGVNSHRMNPRSKTAAGSVRALARALRVSPTTVSEALRGVARVSPATADRVRAAAERYGYRRNPIAGAVMAEIRRSGTARYRGTLALIELAEPELSPAARRCFEELCKGAAQRSAELGFTLDRFLVGSGHLAPGRLNTVLLSRGIAGVLVLPAMQEAHLEAIAWDRLAGVYLDRVIKFPPMHSVSLDHHGAIWMALTHIERLGFRRAGLVLRTVQDRRIQYRWEGGYRAYAHVRAALQLAPILVAPEIDETMFRRWFRQYRPEVVLGHDLRYIDWMKRLGARVPEHHGFMALNATMCGGACAAIDQQPTLIGARAAELVIGQLLRGESGLPSNPCNTSVPARIVCGPTLRAPVGEVQAASS